MTSGVPRAPIWGAFLLLAMTTFPAGAAAQNVPTNATEVAAEPAEPVIRTDVGGADSAISGRISAIFAQIESLRMVKVETRAGVVILSGTVPSTEDRTRAEAIASRVAGVVTIENRLERNLAVDSNLSPALGNIGSKLRDVGRVLPLFGVALAIALLIALLGYFIAGRDRLWRWIAPNLFLAELLASSIRFIAIILGLIAALEILGATALLGAVLGGAGVIGIALGFAVRDTVDNYVSSLMLSLRQPFRANDHVVIEENEGRVVRLTSRATILMTLDGNHLRIPNATVFKAVILNFTRNPQRRFQFDLGVDADDDPVDGMAVGLAAVEGLAFVLDTPKANAIIQDVGDSNIVLRFFGWVDQTRTDFFKGRSLAIQAAKSALEEAGFALPEPIYRLRFDDMPPVQVGAKETAKAKRPRPSPKGARPASAVAQAHDTAPDGHITQMVDEERASSSSQDLLDTDRPVE